MDTFKNARKVAEWIKIAAYFIWAAGGLVLLSVLYDIVKGLIDGGDPSLGIVIQGAIITAIAFVGLLVLGFAHVVTLLADIAENTQKPAPAPPYGQRPIHYR